MEQSNAPSTPARPGLLNILCILTMIGSGIMALFSLIGIFASGWVMSLIGGKMNQVAASSEYNNVMDSLGMSDSMGAVNMENMHQATEVAGGFMAMGTGILIAIFVVSLLLNILKFMGAMRMYKLKKSGFWMYMVPALLIFVLCLISMQWVSVIVFGLFIGGYFSIKKALI